ncbi:hypothetical protein [uncultured Nostoc sp.]|uniref:hypothetical protein n=1 Tax=uncultured Nostoc sp. TaxID=340711 RepID=UPI0035CBC046
MSTTGDFADAWTVNQSSVVISEHSSSNHTIINILVLIPERFYLCKQKHQLP